MASALRGPKIEHRRGVAADSTVRGACSQRARTELPCSLTEGVSYALPLALRHNCTRKPHTRCLAKPSHHARVMSALADGRRRCCLAEAQRELLQDAKQLAGAGSLIPAEMSYRTRSIASRRRRRRPTSTAGTDCGHQCTHARYVELTSWKAPVGGSRRNSEYAVRALGPSSSDRAPSPSHEADPRRRVDRSAQALRPIRRRRAPLD